MKDAIKLSRKSSIRGFTIVELIVIIVVIAILASVVIVSYRVVTQQSQSETAKADAQTAAAAINKYKAEAGAYPTTLSQVTIAKTQSSFNYVPNGATYCIEATFNEQVANVVSGATAATEGACPATNPVTPVTITNLAANPSAEMDLSGVSGYFSATPRRVGGGAVSGNTSFITTTASSTQTQGLIHYVMDTVAGKQYTCAMSFKGTDGVTIRFSGRAASSAGAYVGENYGVKIFTLSSTAWTRKTITFTTPTNTGKMYVQYVVSPATAGVAIQTDALMCTAGAVDYNYADGDSTGWTWSGARQQSASSGPSTGVAPAN